jgi:AcrR family transcriptional regulator
MATPRKAKTPDQERGHRRVQLLLDTAADLVLIHGPEGLRMDMVAKKAATSPGSLYQFFPNRTALLTALIERYGKAISALAKDIVREQTEQPPATMAQAARDFLAPFLDFYARNRAYVILTEAADRVFSGLDYGFGEDDDVALAMRQVLQPFVSAAQQDRLDLVCQMTIVTAHAAMAKSFDLTEASRAAWLAELDRWIQSYVQTLQEG